MINSNKTHLLLEQFKNSIQQWLEANNKSFCVEKCHYEGEALVFEVHDKNDKSSLIGILKLNISDESYLWEQGGKTIKRLLDLENLETAFRAYLLIHGRTQYYLECYQKSCIRFLFDTNMKKRDVISKPLIDKYLWEAGITGGKTAKEIGEELSRWNKENNN